MASVISDVYPGMNIVFPMENLHVLPEFEEPAWLEVECCLDTGFSIHAADRIDFRASMSPRAKGVARDRSSKPLEDRSSTTHDKLMH